MIAGMVSMVNLNGNLTISVINNRMRVTQDSHPYFFNFVYDNEESAKLAKEELIKLIKSKTDKLGLNEIS